MGGTTSTDFDYDAQLQSDKVLQTAEVKSDDKDNKDDCTIPRRNIKSKDRLVRYPLEDNKEIGGLKTTWECFQHSVKSYPDNNFLGARLLVNDEKSKESKDGKIVQLRKEYTWISYSQVDKQAREFGSGLLALGAQEKDAIGIYSINRPEWTVACLGIHSQNLKTVSLYATLGNDAVEYIIKHADISIVVTEKANVQAFSALAKKLPNLKVLIQFDHDAKWGNTNDVVDQKSVEAFSELKVKLIGMSEVKKLGLEKEAFPKLPKPEDLAFIMYTSGTTGAPKGAMLRHSNVVSTIASLEHVFPLKPTDSVISYLPLAHIFECVVEAAAMSNGAAIGFYQGDVTKLTEDLAQLKPTMLMGVPRVFSKIYQKIMGAVEAKNCLVKWVFNKAYTGQCTALRTRQPLNLGDDKKIFAPIRARLGLDKCRLIVTGAAPCPAYVIEFLRIVCKDAQVLQGYGMTETSAGISIVTPGDSTMGHCGAPFPCCEVKLRDVPEMKYFHTENMGEIMCRGPNIFSGYYKNDEATKETLEDNGWLATGDIGRFNPNGTLSIIDRKKNIFKLSQGEYIAAERVETVYSKSSAVGQIWVYGNSFKSFVVAVVVPSIDFTKLKATELGWWTGSTSVDDITAFADLYKGTHAEAMKKIVFDEINKQNSHLKGFEKVKDIIIEAEIDKAFAGFTEKNDCLTPSFKLKRPFLVQRYLKQLKDLYSKNGEPAKDGEKWPGEK